MNKDEKRPDPFAEYERLSGNSGMGEGHQQKEPSWWRDKPADAAKATVNETLTVPPGVQAIAEKAAAFLAYENYTIMSPKGVERAAIPIIAEACREVKVAADKAWLDADKVLGEVNDELVKTKAKLAEALEMFVARGHLLDINHATIADLKAKLAEATGIIECLESQTKLLDDGQLGYLHGEALVVNKLIDVERERNELRHWRYLTECHAPYDAACATLHIEIEELTTKLADAEAKGANLQWWQEHGQRLRNEIAQHLVPGACSDAELEKAPAQAAAKLAEAEGTIEGYKDSFDSMMEERVRLQAKLAEVERDGETASHNAKYYADMSLKLEDEVEKLRGVLEEIAETEMTEMDETSEYAISEEPVLGATAMCNIAKAALKPRAEPKKEEQDESK